MEAASTAENCGEDEGDRCGGGYIPRIYPKNDKHNRTDARQWKQKRSGQISGVREGVCSVPADILRLYTAGIAERNQSLKPCWDCGARDGHEASLLATRLVWLASWRVSPELGLTHLARGEVSHRCPHSCTSEADV